MVLSCRVIESRKEGKMNIAVFASGRGSNFSAIAQAAKKGILRGAHISLLVCDNPHALVIRRAQEFKVKTLLALREDFRDQTSFERAIIQRLKAEKIDLVVLAGFMCISTFRTTATMNW